MPRRSAPRAGGRLAVLFVLAIPAIGGAHCLPPGDDDLATDRPGFGESDVVVGRRIQIESGFTLERTDQTHRRFTAPDLLARIGVTSRLELRFSNDGVIRQSTLTPSGWAGAYGRADSELGAKVQLFDARRCGNLSIVPYLWVPTGSQGFGSDHYDPGVEIAGALKLPGQFAVSGTLNASDAAADARRAWQREVSVSLERDWAHGLGTFAEIDTACADGRCGTTLDGGLTYGVGDNAQLDVEVGRGLHGLVQDWFVGAGYVFRTPVRMRRR